MQGNVFASHKFVGRLINLHTHKPVEFCDYDLESSTVQACDTQVHTLTDNMIVEDCSLLF